jgi:hypothetical protein
LSVVAQSNSALICIDTKVSQYYNATVFNLKPFFGLMNKNAFYKHCWKVEPTTIITNSF